MTYRGAQQREQEVGGVVKRELETAGDLGVDPRAAPCCPLQLDQGGGAGKLLAIVFDAVTSVRLHQQSLAARFHWWHRCSILIADLRTLAIDCILHMKSRRVHAFGAVSRTVS